MFCDTELAKRIERSEAELIAAGGRAADRRRGGGGFLIPIAGGVATFAEPGSPFNKVAGVGFDGAPTADELDEVERAFAEQGADVQFELAHIGDPHIGASLTERGYRLISFENVLGRALADGVERVSPPGVEVRRSGDDEFDAWVDIVADGFAHPDSEGVPSHEDFSRDEIEQAERDFAAAGGLRYMALHDTVPAAGASLHLGDGVAHFAGSATAPAHRRRGIQSALLAARLADAAAAGCDIAVISTQPGSKSQENVQRRGFDLLYTRAILA
jgi:GNAT superfamily N-acetyltransferase